MGGRENRAEREGGRSGGGGGRRARRAFPAAAVVVAAWRPSAGRSLGGLVPADRLPLLLLLLLLPLMLLLLLLLLLLRNLLLLLLQIQLLPLRVVAAPYSSSSGPCAPKRGSRSYIPIRPFSAARTKGRAQERVALSLSGQALMTSSGVFSCT